MRKRETGWATRTLIENGAFVGRKLRTYRLRVTSEGKRTEEITVARARIGSRPGLELCLKDDTVSRLHCEIIATESGFRLVDLGSRNGTRVDGYGVRDIDLKHGSVIELGRSRIVFQTTETETDVPVSQADRFEESVGGSVAMRELFALLDRAAPTTATVLLQGESGTGKEAVARSVHQRSGRSGAWVVVDCGALPPNLLESELFGHEKGAFTGAASRRIGLMEEAEGGTLFLDEIGELPLDMQPKLLRALESREIRRIGGRDHVPLDIRVVAATNRDLAREVNRGSFREDLYYRLAVVELRLPPLRERCEDIPLLVAHFVRQAHRDDPAAAERLLAGISEENWRKLKEHPWPGNVRELRNVIERSLILKGDGEMVIATDAPQDAGELSVDLDQPFSAHKQRWVESFERSYVLGQLSRHDGNVSAAARASGLERMHFKRILKKYR
ncbi:MAG: sigma 54-interacting transcriptional regulator [Myxococcota bacterium]